MKKNTWRQRIRRACREAGTYKPCFDHMIDSLAGILETRDKARAQFEESGAEAVVEHTNKNGNTNLVKNPALSLILECESQALTFWRELGLTPAGLKRIDDKGFEEKEQKEKTALDLLREKHGK